MAQIVQEHALHSVLHSLMIHQLGLLMLKVKRGQEDLDLRLKCIQCIASTVKLNPNGKNSPAPKFRAILFINTKKKNTKR